MNPTNLITLVISVATLPYTAPKLTAYKLVSNIFVPSFRCQNKLKCSYENHKIIHSRIIDIYAFKEVCTNEITYHK